MNTIEVEGFCNFVKPGKYGVELSISLQAGKNQDGTYRKEYFNAKVSDQTIQQYGQVVDGSKVKVKGRLRNQQYTNNQGEKKSFPFIEVFEFQTTQQPDYQQYQQGQAPYTPNGSVTTRPPSQPPQPPARSQPPQHRPQPPQHRPQYAPQQNQPWQGDDQWQGADIPF